MLFFGGSRSIVAVVAGFFFFSPTLDDLPGLCWMLPPSLSPTFVDRPGRHMSDLAICRFALLRPSLSLLLCVTRSLHRWLLSMHATAILFQAAGVAMYMLPVSDSLCFVAHRILGVTALLFDVSKLLHARGNSIQVPIKTPL